MAVALAVVLAKTKLQRISSVHSTAPVAPPLVQGILRLSFQNAVSFVEHGILRQTLSLGQMDQELRDQLKNNEDPLGCNRALKRICESMLRDGIAAGERGQAITETFAHVLPDQSAEILCETLRDSLHGNVSVQTLERSFFLFQSIEAVLSHSLRLDTLDKLESFLLETQCQLSSSNFLFNLPLLYLSHLLASVLRAKFRSAQALP